MIAINCLYTAGKSTSTEQQTVSVWHPSCWPAPTPHPVVAAQAPPRTTGSARRATRAGPASALRRPSAWCGRATARSSRTSGPCRPRPGSSSPRQLGGQEAGVVGEQGGYGCGVCGAVARWSWGSRPDTRRAAERWGRARGRLAESRSVQRIPTPHSILQRQGCRAEGGGCCDSMQAHACRVRRRRNAWLGVVWVHMVGYRIPARCIFAYQAVNSPALPGLCFRCFHCKRAWRLASGGDRVDLGRCRHSCTAKLCSGTQGCARSTA